ncbi:hypothetical protein CQW23_07438 [Capsicum baccatum]|uniref:Uncharacterized protein n=1 Tax=Capsicum baccatum TaxID=33114 RepID=A0A2G2X673_CAPBA|nr:hypothetical protein CQW23_07438 [Capsicum baccatum]
MMSLDATRDDETPSRYGQPIAETPGSCANNASEYFIKIKKANNWPSSCSTCSMGSYKLVAYVNPLCYNFQLDCPSYIMDEHEPNKRNLLWKLRWKTMRLGQKRFERSMRKIDGKLIDNVGATFRA